MANKTRVPNKSKSITAKGKTPAKPASSSKLKSAKSRVQPKAATSSKPVASTKKAVASAPAKPNKTVAKVVKAAAAKVKPTVKPATLMKTVEKTGVAKKTQGVAAIAPRVSAPAKAAPAAVAKVQSPARPVAAVAPAAAPRAAIVVPQPVRAVAAVSKPFAQKISVAAPITPKNLAERVAAAQQQQAAAAQKKPVNQRHGFKKDEFIVYPAHGVGRIVAIEEQEIAGMSLELFVISFEKDKMTLRVPTGKLASVGMRKLAEENVVSKAMETLKGRARVKRTMWSRRAQEYEAKINSGDLVSIAEVVRDLYRSEQQPEQSYSERQLYEAALDRMAREIAAVDKIDERGAVQRITEVLSRSAKGRRLAAESAEAAEAEEVKAA